MSTVLQVSSAVSSEVGVMRESEASKFFTSTFVSGVGVGDGAGSAFLTGTPLFHTSFLLDLMQVYLIPAEVLVCPCFAHLVPGVTAAFAKGVIVASTRALTTKRIAFLRIEQLCGTKADCSSGAIASFHSCPFPPQESPHLNLGNPF